jgi:putative glutathione S-transferase
MGTLVDGAWQSEGFEPKTRGGRFERSPSRLRNWVTPDGGPGPSGTGGFKAEKGRYHLYIARACPWAHRTMIFREIKGLQSMVSYSVVHWLLGKEGWTFETGPGATGDTVNKAALLRDIYLIDDRHYSGRVTVPVLWDKSTSRIVSNESADIIRMFNSAFDALGGAPGDYYPQDLRDEIDALNQRIYDSVNNGVYRAGFATTQEAHEEAVLPLFESLGWLDGILSRSRYLCGDRLTEADWRLFTTLLRFDTVYVGHFKCNLRRLVDYPALWSYTRELFQMPHVRDTVDFDHIKRHYYASHRSINPTGIVPLGPLIDFEAAPSRPVAA